MITETFDFSEDELETIKICMEASCMEMFFPEWEFHTLFGMDRVDLKEAINLFPNLDCENEVHDAAMRNSLLHLVFYPHGCDKELKNMLNKDLKEIKNVIDKIIATDKSKSKYDPKTIGEKV